MPTIAELSKGFADAAQSLKLYRRAELHDAASNEPLIEKLYVDPLQNDAVLETMLRPSTTFLIGRKGTGKSTVFQRAQYEIRKQRRAISAYVDVKTIFESAMVDPDVVGKLSTLGAILSERDTERILLYRAFTKAVFEDVQKEIKSQISGSTLSKLKEAVTWSRNEAIEAIDDLLDGPFESEFTDVTAFMSPAVSTTEETKGRTKESDSAEAAASYAVNPSVGTKLASAWENVTESSSSAANQYSKALLRTVNINAIIKRLQGILSDIGVRQLFIFIDDFSELPYEAMVVFVDTVLAPLNNWSNELIKFKVAAYPGRVYLGAIDATKIDEVYLDIYRLYGLTDVATMEDKAIDFTRRLLNSRAQHFLHRNFDELCDDDSEIYQQFFYASMGNPRILGHLLHNLRESHVAYGHRIGVRAIQEAAAKYYEEKVEPFFGNQKYIHESFEERSSIFSLKELVEELVKRARELRDYKGSAVTRELPGRTPSSHFHIISELESLLSTLELNFFLTRFYEMKDRDGRKVGVYALNYGLCVRYGITFGRPNVKREHRLYFVERIFDYTNILRRYLEKNQELKCTRCSAVHGLDKLASIRLFDMMCPTCKRGVCQLTNLSKKYQGVLANIEPELLLPPTEIGILDALFVEGEPMLASEIAGELDCSYQLVGKRGKILAERGLVTRDKNEKGRRKFDLTERAKDDYFADNESRRLDLD